MLGGTLRKKEVETNRSCAVFGRDVKKGGIEVSTDGPGSDLLNGIVTDEHEDDVRMRLVPPTHPEEGIVALLLKTAKEIRGGQTEQEKEDHSSDGRTDHALPKRLPVLPTFRHKRASSSDLIHSQTADVLFSLCLPVGYLHIQRGL